MKIGIIDADVMWRYSKSKAHKKTLTRLYAYHKEKGDDIDWYNALEGHYDIVYILKNSTHTPVDRTVINADRIICGGKGWYIQMAGDKIVLLQAYLLEHEGATVEYNRTLIDRITNYFPDDALYPTRR